MFAVDSSEAKCKLLRRRFAASPHVRSVQGDASVWRPEAPLDAVLIVDAYHEFDDGLAVLRGIRGSMREGARLVIVDFMRPELGELDRKSRREHHATSPEAVLRDLAATGFRVSKKDAPFVRRDPENRRIASRDVFLIMALR